MGKVLTSNEYERILHHLTIDVKKIKTTAFAMEKDIELLWESFNEHSKHKQA